MFDAKGRFWFDNWAAKIVPHAVYYDIHKPVDSLHRFQFINAVKTYHETGGFMQQTDGRIWVKGLKVFGYYTEGEKEFQIISSDYKTEQGILYEEVTFLFEDREKNVWVCTLNNGLYRCNPSQQFFTNVWHSKPGSTAVQDGGIMSFMEVKNNELFVGSRGQGVIRYDKNFKLLRFGIKGVKKDENPFAWSMCASADSQTVWIGAQPGLYTYDKATEMARFRDPDQLKHKTIEQVAEDKKGNLWLGLYYGGIYRWIDPKNFKKDSIVRVEGAGMSTVNKILCDSKGLVWVATDTAGLFLFDGATGGLLQHFTLYNKNDGDGIGPAVAGVMEYNDSLVLIANATQLFFYNRLHKSIRPVYLPQPLMGNIASFQKDGEGNIWISTTNALYRMHPAKRTLVFFNRMDGIANDHFELNASYKMKDGRLLFGNSNSFIVFNPKAMQLDNKPAPIVFTSITAGKTELPVDSVITLDALTLDHKHNSLTIAFSALNFSSLSLIQNKMEGLDDDWHFADKNNRASFPFLPPGRYKLLLRTLNSEGVPADKPTELIIRIRPPFYQTWWFYTLVALAFVMELYWLDHQRGLRKKGLQKVRTDISDNLHKEVAEALSNINILSEIARLKSDKEPARAKEYMEQIHAKSHNMIIAMDDMLWSLDPANDSMDKTISRIKEFADALMQRHAVLIELLIDKNVERLQLNMKLRHEAFLLFKEGLRSLVGAGTPHCIVHLAMEKAKLLFTIEFDNEGCDRQQLNNLLHRRDMEARLNALNARLDVQLHKSRSVFMLQLPLG